MPLADSALRAACAVYNQFRRARFVPAGAAASPEELRQIEEHARSRPSDISDHLGPLFAEAIATRPDLIVELGVRGGESTFALERAARLSDAYLLSLDIEDCLFQCAYPKWSFIRRDDVAFAAEFGGWCASQRISAAIDVLFIDTSHDYEHTREELRVWLPHLSPKGKVMLHDTNMKRIYRRADRSLGVGWNSGRGVIRAIEDFLSMKLDEKRHFVTVAGGWIIRHWAHCNGLTVMEKYDSPACIPVRREREP